MPKFLLEIGFEEMPARFLSKLEWDLSSLLSKALLDADIEFEEPRVFATPRRLAALVESMDPAQKAGEEIVMGPPMRVAYDADGNPTKAALGFAKTQGVDLADAFARETDKGAYLAVRKQSGGGDVMDLLPDICAGVVAGLTFPKKMHWGGGDFTFGRPLRWILALFGDRTVDLEVGGMRSSNATFGHRVHGPGPWTVADPGEYLSVLADKGRVVLDSEERKRIIHEQGEELARQAGGRVVWDQGLLEEVVGLVELPTPVLGNIDPSFLELPREVLLTTIQSHQKCFGVEDGEGRLLPYFLCTLNLEPKDPGLVRKGWERVLKARLEDARFFWKADLATHPEDWVVKLDNVVYLGPLGSMGDKARRLECLCTWLAKRMAPELQADAGRAGRLAKADLVTEMVGEFADLQGIMGSIYALRTGETTAVARALGEQYLPAGPDSPVPATPVGTILSLCDKADALVGCFGLNMIPTGAADPYGLRRAALGISRMVMETGFRLSLSSFLKEVFKGYGEVEWKLQQDEIIDKLLVFFEGRLKSHFQSVGFETLLIEAAVGAGIDDIWALRARLEALTLFRREKDFGDSVLTFKRAANIIRKQGAEAGQELTGLCDPALLEAPEERALAEAIGKARPRFESLWGQDEYVLLMRLLRELRPAVDAFFDNVMVMAEDPGLRLNRLNLLKSLVDMLGRLADFNALQM